MSGTIKNFDALKGWGFIAVDDFPADVYFKSDLPLQSGQEVDFVLRWTTDGKPQGRDVLPSATSFGALAQSGSLNSAGGGGDMGGSMGSGMGMGGGGMGGGADAVVTGVVKSFSEKNGYGFITSNDFPQDIYFQRKDLPQHMQALPPEGVVGSSVQVALRMQKEGKPSCQELIVLHGPHEGGGGGGMMGGMGGCKGGTGMGNNMGGGMGGMGGMNNSMGGGCGGCGGCCGGGGGCMGGGGMGGGCMGMNNMGCGMGGGMGNKRMGGGMMNGGCGGGMPAAKRQRMGDDADGSGEQVPGVIKSFNPTKGFGFLSCPIFDGDVYFKGSFLPPQMQTASNLSGTQVMFTLNKTGDGRAQAANLVVDA